MNSATRDRGVGVGGAAMPPQRPSLIPEGIGAMQVLKVLLVVAVVGLLVVGLAFTPNFTTLENVKAILRSASLTGIIATGMTLLVISGNSVSLGIQQTVIGGAMLLIVLIDHGMAPGLAIALMMLAVVAVGLLQGVIVAAGLNPIVTTLAAGSIVFGIASSESAGTLVKLEGSPLGWAQSSIFGIPAEIVAFIAFAIVVSLVVERTVIGRQLTLAGANRETSNLNGISFTRVTLVAFAVFSIALGIAAVLYVSQFNQATPQSLGSLTVDVIAAVLLGGVAIQGGAGSPWQSAAGAVFIATITNVLLLNGLDEGKTMLIEGALVAFTVAMLALARRGTRS